MGDPELFPKERHLLKQCVLCSVRGASERSENAAWEKTRLGAPGVGRVRRAAFQHPARSWGQALGRAVT